MAADNRHNGRKVYYLVPGDRITPLEQDFDIAAATQPLGPLGEDMPSQEPELRPGYSPRKGGKQPMSAPRGFFLDRYVY